MAENADLEVEDETESESESLEDQGGGKRKIVIIAMVALFVLGGVGAAMLLLAGGENDGTDGEIDAAAGDASDGTVQPTGDPIYVSLDPAFVVNFLDKKSRTKFLKAELNVLTYDEDVQDAIAKHMPVIRNNLILLFSRQLYEDLVPHEGKEVLRSEALAQVQTVIEQQLGKPGVHDLFFTSFVMQ